MTTWAALSSYVIHGLLKTPSAAQDTESVEAQYDDDLLLISARFALTRLSQHTAEPAQYFFNGDGKTTVFPLPRNMVDNVMKAALVVYDDKKQKRYLPPIELKPDAMVQNTSVQYGYYEWPYGHLSLGFTPAEGSTIILNYFKLWDSPVDGNSEIKIPDWMILPFCYMVAANAVEPYGVQASSIRQWNRKQDSGNPEHNPLHRQTKHFQEQAQAILNLYAPQDRDNFFNPTLRTQTR